MKRKNLKQRIKEGVLALGIVVFGVGSLAAEELIPFLRYHVEEKMTLEVKHPELFSKEEMQKLKFSKEGYINLTNFYSKKLEGYKMNLNPHRPITINARPYFVFEE